MAGKAGDDGPIRPEPGTDLLDRAAPEPTKADEPAQVRDFAGADTGGAPVFVDPSGRRAGRMRRVGWLVAAGCVCSAATLGLVVTDRDSTAPWLSIPGLLGTDDVNRGAEVAGEPERSGSGSPAADNPATTAARPPAWQEDVATTGAEAMTGPRPQKSGTGSAPDAKSSSAPAAEAEGTAGPEDTGSASAGGTEASAGLPSRSPDTAEEPATQPGSQAPEPETPAEPAPSESASTGLIGGLVDAVSGLFGR
ncbi:hypothetical protein [Streptomyces sp. MMBL 11-3]|uniref:hypothetical protein n=1 Tax=Streptomyces sp. MMBL 11-3 TaxID=3382639 RepID=UPI0039B6AE3A